jgi:hypothetical protein
LAYFFQHLVEAITRMGWKDRPPVLSG